MPKISVIIPAYNEEKTILQVLESVAAQKVEGIEFEVVVVDDGSKDRTAELVESRPELYTRFVRMPQNGGKGAAVKAGLKAATGDYILFQDADLEYDPADYVKLAKPVLKFDADIVMGSRVIAPEFIRVYYFWHLVGNRVITFTFNLFNNTTFTDIYSCYLLYRRSLVDPDKLETEGWEQHAEILTKAVRSSTVYYEVPVSYHGRTYAEGKKIKAWHAAGVLWSIFRFAFIR